MFNWPPWQIVPGVGKEWLTSVLQGFHRPLTDAIGEERINGPAIKGGGQNGQA